MCCGCLITSIIGTTTVITSITSSITSSNIFIRIRLMFLMFLVDVTPTVGNYCCMFVILVIIFLLV